MPMTQDVEASIKKALPDALITVNEMGGDDHLEVSVVSKRFSGLSLVQQHQLVYEALKDKLESELIHALALNTSIPS